MKKIFKPFVFLLALLLPTIALAYDFAIDGIQYSIISDSTVKVDGYSRNGSSWYYDWSKLDIEIPSQVSYNNENYTVTAIGDNAFYRNDIFCITIPETVTEIGYKAFCSGYDYPIYSYFPLNVVCLAKSPPEMSGSFVGYDDEDPCINLFVLEASFSLYNEENDTHHFFDNIFITNGERSSIPSYEIDYFNSGFHIKFSNENSIIWARLIELRGTGGCDWIDGGWGTDFCYINMWTCLNAEVIGQAYAIEDGKSPSSLVGFGDYFIPTRTEAFDFNDSGISYNIDSIGQASVTFCYYIDPCCGERNNSILNEHRRGFLDNVNVRDIIRGYYDDYSYYADDPCADHEEYYGNIVIPETAYKCTPWDYYMDKDSTLYMVTSIGDHAFSDCDNLRSVTLSESITFVQDAAFTNCPQLSFLKCFGATPASAGESSFDADVYQNTTLYVPHNAIEAYRQSEGWSNFQNIVGFYDYDFELDGLYYKMMGNGSVVITAGPNVYSGSVNLPTEVTYEGATYTVTGIADGAFANAELTDLFIPVTIRSIGDNAFTGCQVQSLHITGTGTWSAGGLGLHVDNLYIDSGVSGLAGLQVDASVIYCYAILPPVCDEGTFLGYNAELHVPASSLAAYFTAAYWCNFINISSDAITVTEFTLSANSLDLLVGGQATLTATVKPVNATPATITWSSSDEAVATVVNGVVTGVAAGSCDIVAMCQNERAVCHVVVTEILPTSISLNHDNAKIEVGTQLTLTATVQPDDATMTTVTWSTDNPAVATVADGVVTAVGPGECVITASCGECQAQCHIIVVEHLIYITLDKHEVSLLPNHIITLTPTVTPVATELVVASSNPSVAAARMANGLVQVVGISEGEAMITLRSSDGYAEPDSCLVTVYTEKGDLNCDGYVDINDVTALIDHVLGNPGDISIKNADVNHDGDVDINDVTALINYILRGSWPDEPEDPNQPATETFTVNGVSFTMVEVEGGTFTMGATPEQGDEARDNEKPAHQVTLSGFNIGQTEVTQELWMAVMGSNPSDHTGDLQRPVDKVSWEDCQAFIAELNRLTGKSFRLPTEAEWEYAARGGNKSQGYKYAGGNDMDVVSWHAGNSENTTHAVGTKASNELGLYDMTGNVWEWCNDWYLLYTDEEQTDPIGPSTGTYRVLRGGCWNGNANYNRISFRDYFMPTGSNSSGGLRLVLDQNEEYTVNGVTFKMVRVHGGTFGMGTTVENDSNASEIEAPIHDVTLSTYCLGETEVTQELWQAVMGTNPSHFSGDPQRPVDQVNYEDCQTFIAALNDLTGENFRMPTEAEWEFAARGGNTSRHYMYSGSDDITQVAWYKTNSGSTTHAVATKQANELGIFDMSGNVCEWVHDWVGMYPSEPQTNPTGPESAMSRVHRGGAFSSQDIKCAITRRNYHTPGIVRDYMGFRLAK